MTIRRLIGLFIATAISAGAQAAPEAVNARASIRVTGHGVFHILAKDYLGAGFGIGFAQASEAICDIASRVVTINAQRSLHFGPDESTGDFYNNPKNLESDFFWQRVNDAGLIERELGQRAPIGPTPELRSMLRGYVAGFNKYLAQTGIDKLPDRRCRGKAWVRPITERDLYLRAMHWNLFRSGSMMLSQIVAAAPPGQDVRKVALMDDVIRREAAQGWGSNMMALGGEATDNGQGMLFANPHWTWYGPDRWIEMQVTIPGKLNVIGMQTMGLPVVQTGFNQHVAWAGTTSMPMRYTLQKLKLGRTPTSYIVDGIERSMTPRTVRVQVRDAGGAVETREHIFWETAHGLMVTDPAFGWTTATGYEMRDVGYTFRWISQQLRLNASTSAEDLSEAGKRFMAIGWRNLSAADDKGNIFYGDRTAVPAVPNDLVQNCRIGKMSDKVLVLDGSRSACEWRTIAGAPLPGIYSADQLPQLHRRDYMVQSNDTHWLNNARQPLEGFPVIMGAERTPRDLRTRNALLKVENRLSGTDGYPGNRFTLNLLKTLTMNNRVYSADIWLDDLAKFCQPQTDTKIKFACHILTTWDRTENIDSPGALLWRHFALAIEDIDPANTLAIIPFDLKDPLHTPSGLKSTDGRVRKALDTAIAKLEGAKIPLDATLRRYQYADKNGQRIPISGGEAPGQYNLVYNDWVDGKGYPPIVGGPTFIMWMQFTPKGPVGESVLAFSQSPNVASPYYADQTLMWSERRTKKMLFEEADILADPALKTIAICGGSKC